MMSENEKRFAPFETALRTAPSGTRPWLLRGATRGFCEVSAASVREPPSDLKVLAQNILFGGMAGVTGQLSIFPMYTAKTALQNNAAKYNRGLLHALKDIKASSGMSGLYAGMRPVLIMTFPEKAIKLAMNDFLRKRLANSDGEVTLLGGMAAGAGAGLTQSVVTNPMELLMITMQTKKAGAGVEASAGGGGALTIARSLGVRGLFADVPATLLRDIPFSMIFFPTNAYLQDAFSQDGERSVQSTLAPGFIAGCIAGTLSTPMDVVKTQVQAETGKGLNTHVPKVVRMGQIFGEVYGKYGMQGLFKGVGPRILIISPLFGITTMFYELLKKLREKGLM